MLFGVVDDVRATAFKNVSLTLFRCYHCRDASNYAVVEYMSSRDCASPSISRTAIATMKMCGRVLGECRPYLQMVIRVIRVSDRPNQTGVSIS